MGQDIGRHIDLHAVLMSKGDPLLHLIRGEILRPGPEAEGVPADVDRIRAVKNGDL